MSLDKVAVVESDFDLLTALRKRLGADASAESMMAALEEIAVTQPALAIDFAHELGRTAGEKSMLVSELAKNWTTKSPQEAWAWLGQLSYRRIDELAEGGVPAVVFGTIARNQPEMLVTNLNDALRAGETAQGVSRAVTIHLGLESLVENDGLEAARRSVEGWATDASKPAIGSSAYLTVANAMHENDPAAATRWLEALPASNDRDEAFSEFAAHWAQKDPRAALHWAESLPGAELQMSAVQRTFNDWVERDAAPATQWLGDFLSRAPINAETDRLIEAAINLSGSLKISPADALQWNDLISDAVKRAAYEEKIALRWGRQDLAAATNYVWNSRSISSERKQAVIQQIKQQQGREFND
ncbi:hypothetical protein [Oleiharenicola lentus]|uniref:hypothetical protein n=1 Tax=Oleiharenicola lentus TaxID=2508720 RepID=UPI003F66A48C